LKNSGAAALALLALCVPARAQEWPTRPVTMVIPFAAGGPTDLLGRVMAASLSERLGQQIVVENVGGAGGMTEPTASRRRRQTATSSCSVARAR
jgi:tripartite-type tricarboxylate transporter receptor subunit TctC